MNDNTNLFTHMRTDPNAWKHAFIGFGMFLFGMSICTFIGLNDLAAIAAPLIAGIAIEIVQRIQGGTNTNRESFFDILTTWLFFLYPVAQWTKK